MTDAQTQKPTGIDNPVDEQANLGNAISNDAPKTEEPQAEAEPLTQDTIRKIAQEVAISVAQSQVAKGENRINKRINEQFNALKVNQKALGLSDDQVEKAKQKIISDAYSAEDEAMSQPQAQADPAPGQNTSVDDFLNNVFAEAGEQVKPSDPEWKALQEVLDANADNPKGMVPVILAATAAAKAKAERLASQKENAAARVGGGETSTTGKVIEGSALDMLEKAYQS